MANVTGVASPGESTLAQTPATSIVAPPAQQNVPSASSENTGDVLTVTSGKQIHIYHDFPTLAKGGSGWWNTLGSNGIRIVVLIIVILAIALSASVIATARINEVSLGESLDLVLKSLGI
jgi:hypothetical protein